MNNGKNIKRNLFLILIALTIFFIWSNSLKPANSSMNESNSVKEFILMIFSKIGIDLNNTFFIEFIRKIGHFTEYFILGTELMIFRCVYFSKSKNALFNIFYIGVITAFIDESIQLIPALGRSAEIADVWIDIFGVTVGFLIVFLVNYIINLIRND